MRGEAHYPVRGIILGDLLGDMDEAEGKGKGVDRNARRETCWWKESPEVGATTGSVVDRRVGGCRG